VIHSYVFSEDEGTDYCVECELERRVDWQAQADGARSAFIYRKWGETRYTESEPRCIE